MFSACFLVSYEFPLPPLLPLLFFFVELRKQEKRLEAISSRNNTKRGESAKYFYCTLL